MVFQDFNLLNSLTVKENILTPLVLDHKLYEINEGHTISLVQMLDIQEIMDKYTYEISGGEKQRAAICRAIINNPKILFADEPTGNLDSKISENILSYFDSVHSKFGISIVMVTHDPFSACHCQRVVFLKDGRNAGEIVRDGDNHAFFDMILSAIQKM
jgi:putative ABC transport system ATP-binding protein